MLLRVASRSHWQRGIAQGKEAHLVRIRLFLSNQSRFGSTIMQMASAEHSSQRDEGAETLLKTKREFAQHDIEQRAYGLWQADGGRHPETYYWHKAREELERERDNGSVHPWRT